MLCTDCRFWRDRGYGLGECRRLAPRPITRLDGPQDAEERNREDYQGWWPNTWEHEWCGEFADREKHKT